MESARKDVGAFHPTFTIPHLDAPHDALRHGGVMLSLTDEVAMAASLSAAHPVQALARESRASRAQTERQTMEGVYGSAFVMQRDIERQMLSKFRRLPGLPSSQLGLRSLTGELDSIDIADTRVGAMSMEREEQLPRMAYDMHYEMELRMGLVRAPPSGITVNRP